MSTRQKMKKNEKIEKINDDLFCIKIPLPDTPLQFLNSIVIKGNKRNLIIDTGLYHECCFNTMMAGLKELDVDINITDFFITHMHADHFGLLPKLLTPESQIYFNYPEAKLIELRQRWETMFNYAAINGFPESKLRQFFEDFPEYRLASEWTPNIKLIKDHDHIKIGRYKFECIETPGHTIGHICLYEPEYKIFIAGDHIMTDITPNIQCWEEKQNPLDNYIKSLNKVYSLDVNIVIPGHKQIFINFKTRIDEIKFHHMKRLKEIMEIVSKKSINAYEVASHMAWYDSWKNIPLTQRWFATGEAIAHLHYLEKENRINKGYRDGIIIYSNS